MESKQCTPSVIARLMGLDELPPQQPVCKPQRVLSENYLRKSASIGLLEKRSCHKRHSLKIKYERGQEFINAFEVPEIATTDRHCIQSTEGGKANSSMTEVTSSFVRHNFTDEKCLSICEKLRHSKEFDDVQEELDSDKDLLIGYLQQPDSLFTNHLRDLQFGQQHCQSGHVTVLRSLSASYSRKSEIFRKSERITARQNILRSLKKVEDGFVRDSCGDLGIDNTRQLLKSRLKLKDETCFSPSRIVKDDTNHSPPRIVVLKPNLGKAHNAAKPSFSPISGEVSQLCDRKHVQFSQLKNLELQSQVIERKNVADDLEPSGHGFKSSRVFAKGMSTQITHTISSSLTEVSRTELRVNETSTDESELMMPSCSSFFDWKNRCQTTYPPLNRSPFAKLAKKRLLDRWKMTKNPQEVGVARRGTTLGEMLAMPDRETKPRNLNYKLDTSGLNNQLNLNNGDADLGSPLGISSRDGWKEECAKSLTRSESLPAACITIETPKSRTRNKAVHNDCFLKLEEYVTQGKNESRMKNCSQDTSEVRVSRFSNEKVETFVCMDLENNHTIQENRVILDEMEKKFEEDLPEGSSMNCNLSCSTIPCSDLEYDQTVQGTMVIQDELKNSCGKKDLSGKSEENYIFPNPPIGTVAASSLGSEVVAVAETENVRMSSGTPEEQKSEPVACILFVKDGHSSQDLDASVGQESSVGSLEEALVPSSCHRVDPEFLTSLGEGHSPSPNSVLEPPFGEEIVSGSEYFQGVGADLRGLRMQLQLLKSESEETNSEGPGMVVSSDDDSGDGSVDILEGNRKLEGLFRAHESRDFSYVNDVLDEAGFHGGNLQLGFQTWHSPDCPVNPSVFDKLEKKYGEQTYWERAERRLLFDLVNLGLKEILQPCMWMKPLRKRFNLSQSREVIEEELWKFLVRQEKEVSKDLSEKALGTEITWFDLRDDIDLFVCEIERFLFDEIAAELVSIENF